MGESGSAKKVLLVDDTATMRSLLKALILTDPTCKDFIFLEADTGILACSTAASQKPDLIFMDLNMPGLDGVEALRKMKETPSTKEIPIVIVSTWDREQQIQECRDMGAAAFVRKPVKLAEVQAVVKKFLFGA